MNEKQLQQVLEAIQKSQVPQQPQTPVYHQPDAITVQGIHKWWPQIAGAALIIAWLWNQSSVMTENNVKVDNRLTQIEKVLTKQEGQPDVKAALETISKIDESQNSEIKSIKSDLQLLDRQIQAIRK